MNAMRNQSEERNRYTRALLAVPLAGMLALGVMSPAQAQPASTGGAALQGVASTEVSFDEVDVQAFEAAVQHALTVVGDPTSDPAAYEAAIVAHLQASQVGAQPRAVPVVIIAGCIATAVPILSSIPANSSVEYKASQIAVAVLGCVGGGHSAGTIAAWIRSNWRTVGIALSAVGLGSLAGDSSSRSAVPAGA